MRILYIIPQAKIGGAEVIFASLNDLSKNNLEIIKLDLEITTNSPFKYISGVLKVRKILRLKKIDIVLSSLWKSHFVVILSSLFVNVKLVPFIHSTGWFNIYDSLFSKLILHKSYAIIADSFSVSEKIKNYLPNKNVYSVSMKINHPISFKQYSERNKMIRFVFLGRLCEVKRIDKMYLFIEQLSSVLPNYEIFLDLYGPMESNFVKIRTDLEISYKHLNVKYLGELQRQDSQRIMLQYDYYLQLSDIEGMAMSVVEAMSIGLIPIVTSVGEINQYARNMYNSITCDVKSPIDELVGEFLLIESDVDKQMVLSENAINTFLDKPLFSEDIFNVLNLMS